MRLRNVKGSREMIAANKWSVGGEGEEKENKGKWNQIFGNENPIHIEIGMGKGKFLLELARQNPDVNYVGIEKFSSVLVRAIQKMDEYEGDNVRFIRMDAEQIEDVFEKNEVKRIYLNFSDPWPKDRHAKRRLTSKEFFARYNNILSPEGKVIFKTDNRLLFDFSVEQVPLANWNLESVTYDLHHSEYVEGNIMTEYESRFVEERKPICRLVASR